MGQFDYCGGFLAGRSSAGIIARGVGEMDDMLAMLRNDSADEIDMLALFRNKFLDIEAVSAVVGHDILTDVVACPKHVVYYAAKYVEILKELEDEANAER